MKSLTFKVNPIYLQLLEQFQPNLVHNIVFDLKIGIKLCNYALKVVQLSCKTVQIGLDADIVDKVPIADFLLKISANV